MGGRLIECLGLELVLEWILLLLQVLRRFNSDWGKGGPVDQVRVKWDCGCVILVLLIGAQLDVWLFGTEGSLGGKLLLLLRCVFVKF